MPNVICGVAALSVATVFYTYRAYVDYLKARQHTLRERVTYMLWVMANGTSDDAHTPALPGVRS
ncbi:MAG: hypothetical protein L0Y71_20810 [Gemmataceae bacterium]|nr:hypothetical protein [Gemmataceae bacterium]